MISAVIMASGYSRRMGRDKLLLPYKGKYLVEQVMETVLKCDFYERMIVARNETILHIAKSMGLICIKNNMAYIGKSQSIKLAMQYAGKSEGYMFFTADQPFIDVKTVEFLTFNFLENKNNIIVPIHKGRRGSPVIFPSRFKEDLKCLQKENGGSEIINSNRDDVIFVEVKNELLLKDVDTEKDYKELINIEE